MTDGGEAGRDEVVGKNGRREEESEREEGRGRYGWKWRNEEEGREEWLGRGIERKGETYG